MSMNIHIDGVDLPQTTTEESKYVIGDLYDSGYIDFFKDSQKYQEAIERLCKVCLDKNYYGTLVQVARILNDANELNIKLETYLNLGLDTKAVAMLFATDLQNVGELPNIEVW